MVQMFAVQFVEDVCANLPIGKIVAYKSLSAMRANAKAMLRVWKLMLLAFLS